MLHETIRNDDLQRNTALQHCCHIVQNCYHIVPALQRCVTLRIVVANRLVQHHHRHKHSCIFEVKRSKNLPVIAGKFCLAFHVYSIIKKKKILHFRSPQNISMVAMLLSLFPNIKNSDLWCMYIQIYIYINNHRSSGFRSNH